MCIVEISKLKLFDCAAELTGPFPQENISRRAGNDLGGCIVKLK
jgi:hypothetical protein